MSTLPASVRIVVPAYNAATTLPSLLQSLSLRIDRASVIVVDDGSEDKTAVIAAEHGALVVGHASNRGKGAALRSGIARGCEDPGVQAVVTMDADGQHDPQDLPSFIRTWQETSADLIIGQRKRTGTAMPLHRRLSNATTSFLVSARTGQSVPDSQCGYRLLSRRAAMTIHPETDGFEAETEWILRAASRRYMIASVPVRTVYAGEGSHMSNWNTVKAFVRVLFREYAWEG